MEYHEEDKQRHPKREREKRSKRGKRKAIEAVKTIGHTKLKTNEPQKFKQCNPVNAQGMLKTRGRGKKEATPPMHNNLK